MKASRSIYPLLLAAAAACIGCASQASPPSPSSLSLEIVDTNKQAITFKWTYRNRTARTAWIPIFTRFAGELPATFITPDDTLMFVSTMFADPTSSTVIYEGNATAKVIPVNPGQQRSGLVKIAVPWRSASASYPNWYIPENHREGSKLLAPTVTVDRIRQAQMTLTVYDLPEGFKSMRPADRIDDSLPGILLAGDDRLEWDSIKNDPHYRGLFRAICLETFPNMNDCPSDYDNLSISHLAQHVISNTVQLDIPLAQPARLGKDQPASQPL